jgi:hypothetical protein
MLATRHDAVPVRSPFVAWSLVLVLGIMPFVMSFTLLPLYVGFAVSRPALDRLADRVAGGAIVRRAEWAGVFLIVGSDVDPDTRSVGLVLDPDPSGRSGFVRLNTGSRTDHMGPFWNLNSDVAMSGAWRYQDED